MKKRSSTHTVYVSSPEEILKLKAHIPENPLGVVIMCSDKDEPESVQRNELVSQIFNKECFITLQLQNDNYGACKSSAVIPALVNWIEGENRFSYLPLYIFCGGNSVNNVLKAVAEGDKKIAAVAIRSGRIALPVEMLNKVDIPVLLLSADRDSELIQNNSEIITHLNANYKMKIISGASRYFRELGKLGHVVFLAVEWFRKSMIKNAISA